jgi:hypothetical protein
LHSAVALPSQPIAPPVHTSALHILAEASQKLEPPHHATAFATDPVESHWTSRSSSQKNSPGVHIGGRQAPAEHALANPVHSTKGAITAVPCALHVPRRFPLHVGALGVHTSDAHCAAPFCSTHVPPQ